MWNLVLINRAKRKMGAMIWKVNPKCLLLMVILGYLYLVFALKGISNYVAQLAYAKDAFIAGLIQNNAVVVPELRGGVTAGRAAFEDTSACYPLYEEPIHVVEYIANVDLQYSTALRVSRDASIATGGYYDPRNCGASKPRTSLAIIVPYRERQENLPAFLGYMHPFLQRQGVEYKFYLISQKVDGEAFNRGSLLNVGYLMATQEKAWDCLVLHDVDLLPENQENVYECWDQPRHMNVASQKTRFRLPYPSYFGGVSAVTPEHYLKANGFSNEYHGWGCEDDDFANRTRNAGYRIERADRKVSRYFALPHEIQKWNKDRLRLLEKGFQRYKTDGINSLQYNVISVSELPLFTNITVSLQYD